MGDFSLTGPREVWGCILLGNVRKKEKTGLGCANCKCGGGEGKKVARAKKKTVKKGQGEKQD